MARYPNDKLRTALNNPITKSLFYEMAYDNYEACIFTIGKEDKPHASKPGIVYDSLYKIYMEHADETEYVFAVDVFGDYDHWLKLCKANWFKPHIEGWRQELELKRLADTLKRVQDIANDPEHKDYYTANKFLISHMKTELKKVGAQRGRPTNKKSEPTEMKKVQIESKKISKDLDRILN